MIKYFSDPGMRQKEEREITEKIQKLREKYPDIWKRVLSENKNYSQQNFDKIHEQEVILVLFYFFNNLLHFLIKNLIKL